MMNFHTIFLHMLAKQMCRLCSEVPCWVAKIL